MEQQSKVPIHDHLPKLRDNPPTNAVTALISYFIILKRPSGQVVSAPNFGLRGPGFEISLEAE